MKTYWKKNLISVKLALLTMACALTVCHLAVAQEHKILDLDFRASDLRLRVNQIAYGSSLIPQEKWLSRTDKAPLYLTYKPKPGKGTPSFDVFETHAVAIIEKNPELFKNNPIDTLAMLRALDRKARNEQQTETSAIKTRVDFPTLWAKFIEGAKAVDKLDSETTTYIEMTSKFRYYSAEALQDNHLYVRFKNLDPSIDLPILGVFRQASNDINQIVGTFSSILVFYKFDDQHVLVASYGAITVKRHVLNMGIGTVSGRGVLMGQLPGMNTSYGIGAGLPQYYLETFRNLIGYLNSLKD